MGSQSPTPSPKRTPSPNDSSTDTTAEVEVKDEVIEKHLFVMINGLFGNPVHLTSLHDTLYQRFGDDSNIEVFRPALNSGLASFDGIKLGAERIVKELNDYFKERKDEENVTFTKISIVGYSLGGLYGRYLIGLLNDLDYFDHVEPIFFSTFATPHVGTIFYSDDCKSKLLNLAGGNILGVSGNDLFSNGSVVLDDLSDENKTFYKGLKKFKHLYLFANAIHDRTVPFYTAYISLKDPFQHRDFLDYHFFHYDNEKYLFKYPEIDSHPNIEDMFIDMEHTQFLQESPGPDLSTTSQERQFKIFSLIALPLILPIVFSITSVTTVVSHYKVKEATRADTKLKINYLGVEGVGGGDKGEVKEGSKEVKEENKEGSEEEVEEEVEEDIKDHILEHKQHIDSRHQREHSHDIEEPSTSNRLAQWTGDAVDEILNVEDGYEPQQMTDSDTLISSTKKSGNETIDKQQSKPSTKPSVLSVRPALGAGTKGLIDETPHSLTLSENVRKHVYSLNKLPWEKYVVKLERMHSHAEIVNRRNKPGQGQYVTAFWVELIDTTLKKDGISTTLTSTSKTN